MNKQYIVKSISQKDNHVFTIEWNDGKISDYRLSELQKNCPCAGCVDEATGNRRSNLVAVNSDVRATRIYSVGRYALRIDFTSGCSKGIYNFDFLRNLSS